MSEYQHKLESVPFYFSCAIMAEEEGKLQLAERMLARAIAAEEVCREYRCPDCDGTGISKPFYGVCGLCDGDGLRY